MSEAWFTAWRSSFLSSFISLLYHIRNKIMHELFMYTWDGCFHVYFLSSEATRKINTKTNFSSPLQLIYYSLCILYTILRVSCQMGPICHAQAWLAGPFWQDAIDIHYTLILILLLIHLFHYTDITWVPWQATQLFLVQIVQANNNEIIILHYQPLWGKSSIDIEISTSVPIFITNTW